jgi:polyhydroxyalkanoate synthesis repressor PhaR
MATVTSEAAEPKPKRAAVIKKYANRRLYNTATSSYVTLEELCRMVRAGQDFVVFDAKTGEDITRSVLTQIILEEDTKGRNLLPISFLRQVIGYYDDSLRAFLPRYLELSMENFASNQEQIRRYIEGTFGRFFPMNQFEDMARQNMALFQRTATMFNPFQPSEPEGTAAGAGETRPPADAAAAPATAATAAGGAADVALGELKELRDKVDTLQRQLDSLTRDREKGRGGG